MKAAGITLALVLSVLTFSCGDSSFTKACTALDRSHGSEKLLAGLIRLDQSYPDRFALKHQIGLLFLQQGNPGASAPYLERARSLAPRRITPADKATLFGGLAIVSYANRDYAQAVEYGRIALNVKAPEAAPFGFITGRALLAQNNLKEALACLDAAWAGAKPSMSAEDYRAYARALQEASRNKDLVAVLDSYESAFPYEPGLGLMQSAAYERLGDYDAAVIAAYKEAEYATAYGASRSADIQQNLAAIGKKLNDTAFNPSGGGTSALEAVKAFARADWETAERLFERRAGPAAFERYLLLSTRIEAGHEDAADIEAFVALRPAMRALPAYYYRLYLGLRASGIGDAERLADLLESAIDPAPRALPALHYRSELAVILGLAASEGPHLLTRAEMSAAADNAAATGETSLLQPLVGTLALKDNRVTLLAVGILRAFAQEARHRPYFEELAASSRGRARERLDYILAR